MTIHELETTVTPKGQVTIPAEIRTRLGLKPKDKVRFELKGDVVHLRRAPSRILEGYGAVASTRRRPEDWTKVRAEIEQSIAEEAASEG